MARHRKPKYGDHARQPPVPSPQPIPIRTSPHRYRLILEYQVHISELEPSALDVLYQTRGLSYWYHERQEFTSNDPARLIAQVYASAIQFPRNRPMQDMAEVMDTIIEKGEFYSRINGHEIRIIDTTRPRTPIRWAGIRGFAS